LTRFIFARLSGPKSDMAGTLADFSKIIEFAPSGAGVEVVYHNRIMMRI